MICFLFITTAAMADSSMCKRLYVDHFERVQMLKQSYINNEISGQFYDERMKDEEKIIEVSEPVLCKGVSAKKRIRLLIQAISESKA